MFLRILILLLVLHLNAGVVISNSGINENERASDIKNWTITSMSLSTQYRKGSISLPPIDVQKNEWESGNLFLRLDSLFHKKIQGIPNRIQREIEKEMSKLIGDSYYEIEASKYQYYYQMKERSRDPNYDHVLAEEKPIVEIDRYRINCQYKTVDVHVAYFIEFDKKMIYTFKVFVGSLNSDTTEISKKLPPLPENFQKGSKKVMLRESPPALCENDESTSPETCTYYGIIFRMDNPNSLP